ncbi:uncharacterized protein RAG0_12680 [Rhynchosporium agropyri]|uniref:Uncharacterized protein n=1 Tax=Rhynchosporium agropyri TaxID=914238 RepID=A0A1E1L9F7_9HELO|nr:uncharacterized protein RAG0_12680 [Rhynchosporium agropyri]
MACHLLVEEVLVNNKCYIYVTFFAASAPGSSRKPNVARTVRRLSDLIPELPHYSVLPRLACIQDDIPSWGDRLSNARAHASILSVEEV